MTVVPELRRGVVDVWRLEHGAAGPQHLRNAIGVLSPDEVARADRQRDPERRDGFVLTRATLRRLLGSYLSVDGRSLVFEGEKPAVPGARVRFSTSMTRGLSLLSFALGVEVGVDVESLSTELDVRELAAVILSPAERAAFDGSKRSLLERWVEKEAVLKAVGVGLRVPPSSFSSPEEVEPGSWTAVPLEVGPTHVAALAAPGPPAPVVRMYTAVD